MNWMTLLKMVREGEVLLGKNCERVYLQPYDATKVPEIHECLEGLLDRFSGEEGNDVGEDNSDDS